jgi:hypothetical protein
MATPVDFQEVDGWRVRDAGRRSRLQHTAHASILKRRLSHCLRWSTASAGGPLLQGENRRYRVSVTARSGELPGGGESTQKYRDGGGTAGPVQRSGSGPDDVLAIPSSGKWGHRKRRERTKASACLAIPGCAAAIGASAQPLSSQAEKRHLPAGGVTWKPRPHDPHFGKARIFFGCRRGWRQRESCSDLHCSGSSSHVVEPACCRSDTAIALGEAGWNQARERNPCAREVTPSLRHQGTSGHLKREGEPGFGALTTPGCAAAQGANAPGRCYRSAGRAPSAAQRRTWEPSRIGNTRGISSSGSSLKFQLLSTVVACYTQPRRGNAVQN